MRELSEAACKQGELWGRAARDWVAIQEPVSEALWTAALDAANVAGGTRLLDAGCGGGGACDLAMKRGAEVFGVDPAVNLITLARARMPRCDFRVAELENLPFPNGEFDAAVAINSLQFTNDPQIALHELGRVCRRDGLVVAAVFSEPERSDAGRVFRAIRALFERPPSSTGAFALSAQGTLRSLVDSVAELRFESLTEVDCAYVYPDFETALRGQMAAGATWRAVEILGEDRVRTAIREALEDFLQPDGTVRLLNRFFCAVAVKI